VLENGMRAVDSNILIRLITRDDPARQPNFSGCLMLQLARKAGQLPLGTFDRSLAKVEGTQKL